MLFLDKKIRLKQDILHILNYRNDFITTEQLDELIPYASFSTIRNVCYELRDEIEEIYAEEEATLLIITGKGIKFIRNNISSKQINQHIYSNNLFHDIFLKILLNRQLNVETFLEENYVSKSTLYNTVRKINLRLNLYQLHISMSHQLKIVGKEHQIRLFTFMYFFYTVNLYKNSSLFPKEISKKTKKVLNYLAIDYIEPEARLIDLLLLITESGHQPEKEDLVSFQETSKHYDFPEKPDFLNHYSDYNWQLFLLMLYGLNIFDFELPHEKKCYQTDIQDWIVCYETTYQPIPLTKINTLESSLEKTLLLHYFFQIGDAFVKPLDIFSFEELKRKTPDFRQTFLFFYHQLSEKNNTFHTSQLLKKTSSYLVSFIHKYPIHIEKAIIFIATDFHRLYEYSLEEELINYLGDFIQITHQIEKADLIISTIPYRKEGITVVEIDYDFSIKDLITVTNHVTKTVDRKNRPFLNNFDCNK